MRTRIKYEIKRRNVSERNEQRLLRITRRRIYTYIYENRKI